MIPRRPRLLSALLLALLSCPARPAGAAGEPELRFPLVKSGRPAARVLVAPGDPAVEPALEDLAAYLERSSGARLEVARGDEDLPGPTLHVGWTAAARALEPLRSRIRIDGFILGRVGEDLVVAGAIPAGTANGLWTILWDHAGVRWYWDGPLWEVVPRRDSVAVAFRPDAGTTARVVNPSFLGRHLWGGPPSAPFGRRSRHTQPGTPLPYVGTGHALSEAVPLEKYAAGHPEYFALLDGRRVVDRESQPCFTHPDMPRLFLEHLRSGRSSLGVNDNLDACRCPRCLAVDGSSPPYLGMWNASESYFALISEVARAAAVELPGRRIGVFAYQLTDTPPRGVAHLGPNVDVVLCQDTSQHFDPETARADRAMSAEWVRKAGGVSHYDYLGIDIWTPRHFLMGGFRGDEVQAEISLEGDRANLRFPGPGAPAAGSGRPAPVRALAARRGAVTVHEAAIEWRWIEGFAPAPGRSLGISIVVRDDDGEGPPMTAEIGGGIFPLKRPSEFAAIRLAPP